jgi:hypothetical protein
MAGSPTGMAKATFASDDASRSGCGSPSELSMPLEHDPEKWIPVFGKDQAPPKN